jgi:hypothetical protein
VISIALGLAAHNLLELRDIQLLNRFSYVSSYELTLIIIPLYPGALLLRTRILYLVYNNNLMATISLSGLICSPYLTPFCTGPQDVSDFISYSNIKGYTLSQDSVCFRANPPFLMLLEMSHQLIKSMLAWPEGHTSLRSSQSNRVHYWFSLANPYNSHIAFARIHLP